MSLSQAKNILLIDEDITCRQTLARVLHTAGFRVVESACLGEAFLLIDIHAISLVLMDFISIEYTQFALLDKIIALCPEIPVITFVLCKEPRFIKRLQALGVYACLTKPIKRKDLLPVITAAIEKKSQE